uniref:(California timema) hypothetical protein n=1 Tax=Timema californicum TaxID=61474 RepID=A0A7R9P2G2_TIMCA|nr:unnamed protein product [Timema californicum]
MAGMGDEALVWGMSRWLMCQQRDGLKSCGQCHGCQLMQANTHPDWYRLEAEKGKSTLGIDAVRQVTEKMYHFGQQGGAKVVWLPDAAQLSEAAANALLKTLEEPPANSWFFLSSRDPSRLLATLRSRCMALHSGRGTKSALAEEARCARRTDAAGGSAPERRCTGCGTEPAGKRALAGPAEALRCAVRCVAAGHPATAACAERRRRGSAYRLAALFAAGCNEVAATCRPVAE